MESGQGFGDSLDLVFDSQGRGRPGSLPLCAPLGSCLPLPSLHEPEPEPEPRALTALGRSTRRRLCLPFAQGRKEYAQPSSDPFSPDEDRRRPAFPLSIFSPSSWSRSCSRCHLKTPQAGEGGRGRGESQESANGACARAFACPQTGNQPPLPSHPEITSWDLFSVRVAASSACLVEPFLLSVHLWESEVACMVLARDRQRLCLL